MMFQKRTSASAFCNCNATCSSGVTIWVLPSNHKHTTIRARACCHSLAVNKAYRLCCEIIEETKMRKNRRDNGTEAVQEDPGNDAEHTAEVSTDASEGESAGTESLQQKVDNVTEAMQEAEGAEQTGHMAETSRDAAERAARVGTEIFQRNVDTVQKALQSSSVVAEVTQSISREWLNFARECMEQNLNQFESLLRCRTPQDIAAVQSKILRDNLECFLQFARRIAKITMQMPDEANKRATEAVRGARAA
jgi:hypothetical protein